MAIITMPTLLAVGRQEFGVRRFDATELSSVTGSIADSVLGPPRWLMSMSAPPSQSIAAMDLWRATAVRLKGRLNYLAAWDVLRPVPRGTMRGSMTLVGSHGIGAESLTLTAGGGQAGATLLEGDWLQVGAGLTGQLVMVLQDATADGSGTIVISTGNPLRGVHAGGTAVGWDKALGHYKQLGTSVKLHLAEGGLLSTGAGFDLIESW